MAQAGLKGQFHHFQINVSNLKKSDKFYHGFLTWLGYERALSIGQTEARDIVGWRRGRSRLFLTQCRKEFLRERFHRKHIGINHIAFWAPSKSLVDKFYSEYLVPNGIPVLYGGPREFHRKGYYAVYFEDPDRLKLELMTSPSFTLNYKGLKRVNLPRH
jgi:catechol 2,3-dioxygenase-like lactoylglutathione lyase family enzyme